MAAPIIRPATELAIGQTGMVVWARNPAGQAILGIRRGDWRKVTISADNIDRYHNGQYDYHTCR